LIRAARYLNCAPWDLEARSVYWQKLAELSELVERRLPEVRDNLNKQRQKVRGEASEDD